MAEQKTSTLRAAMYTLALLLAIGAVSISISNTQYFKGDIAEFGVEAPSPESIEQEMNRQESELEDTLLREIDPPAVPEPMQPAAPRNEIVRPLPTGTIVQPHSQPNLSEALEGMANTPESADMDYKQKLLGFLDAGLQSNGSSPETKDAIQDARDYVEQNVYANILFLDYEALSQKMLELTGALSPESMKNPQIQQMHQQITLFMVGLAVYAGQMGGSTGSQPSDSDRLDDGPIYNRDDLVQFIGIIERVGKVSKDSRDVLERAKAEIAAWPTSKAELYQNKGEILGVLDDLNDFLSKDSKKDPMVKELMQDLENLYFSN